MNFAQYYVPAWMGVGVGGEWIHAFVWLSLLSCSAETTTTLLIGYTRTQNVLGVKKIKRKKEKTIGHLRKQCIDAKNEVANKDGDEVKWKRFTRSWACLDIKRKFPESNKRK